LGNDEKDVNVVYFYYMELTFVVPYVYHIEEAKDLYKKI